MHKRILSATVSIQEETPVMEFSPGINIFCGQNAEDILLTLAGIFGGMPPKVFQAALHWQNGVTFFVSGEDGHVFVNNVKKEQGDSAQLMKNFHKQCFLNFRDYSHILDGAKLPAGTSGASERLLKKLRDTLAQKDDRPLFVFNFLERLDEAVDLQTVFEALNATRRQVFIAVPHYYKIRELEGMSYDTRIYTLWPLRYPGIPGNGFPNR